MRYGLPVLVLVLAGCCGGPQPDAIVGPLRHTVEDMVLCDAAVVPLLPTTDSAVMNPKTGEPYTVQQLWSLRFRAFALRALTLLAWAKDEEVDVAAAHAKLFAKDGE